MNNNNFRILMVFKGFLPPCALDESRLALEGLTQKTYNIIDRI